MSGTKCVKNDKKGWIRKESRSRPNQFYYFNTKTGESRWDGETESSSASEKSKKLSEKIHKNSEDKNVNKTTPTGAQYASEAKEKKLSSKSREVKKTKTPAQDRLKNIMAKTKEIDVSIKKEIEAICNEAKTQLKSKPIKSVQAKQERPPESLSSVVKTNVQVSVRAAANKECDSSAFNPIAVKHKRNRLSATSNKQNKITKTKCSKHKTPAQQRLVDLQKTLLKEQLISKNPGERAPQCSNTVNKLHEPSANALDESKDLTHSGLEVGLIDVDIELTLTQNPIEKSTSADVIDEDEQMEWEPCAAIKPDTGCSGMTSNQADQVFVVPDTNIFLSSLICIKDVIAKEPGYYIKIPYMVLQELDKLKNKENDTVSQMATRAIHYIYENMKDDNQSRFTGQSATDDCRHLIEILCPDDKILNCCMQLKELGCTVILLSNDKNLSIKAKVNHVNTLTSRLCNEKYDNDR